jgi:hypothetical protein
LTKVVAHRVIHHGLLIVDAAQVVLALPLTR